MKKIILTIISGLLCVSLATSCCNCNEKKCDNPNSPCEQTEMRGGDFGKCDRKGGPRCEGKEAGRHCKFRGGKPCDMWQKFDSMTVEEKKAFLAEKKAFIDEQEAKMKQAKEEFEAKWNNFENLTIEEQKELLEKKFHFMHRGPRMGGDKCSKAGKAPHHKHHGERHPNSQQ